MNGTSKALINLLRGWPNPHLLPVSILRNATNNVWSDPTVSTTALLYGPDPGYEPLREQIAAWLTAFYGPEQSIPPGRICITGGASQNLACILQVFSDPVYTRNVWMVAPTYFLACRIFEDSGFQGKLRAVPEDEEGLDCAYLSREIRQSEEAARAAGNLEPKLKPPRPWSKIYRHLIYAVPTFANPSSTTMTLRRRQELVRIAREYDALVITDDVYDQLQWSPSSTTMDVPPQTAAEPRLVDLDRYLDGGAEREGSDGYGNAVSNGSFSKIVGPGCRTGWAEGTEKFAHGLSQVSVSPNLIKQKGVAERSANLTSRGSSRSGGAPSQLTATFIAEILKSGDLQRYIGERLQPAYASRYRTMMAAIDQLLLPLGVTVRQKRREVVGGYFLWLTLPEPLNADEVAGQAQQVENLVIAPGSLFGVKGDDKDPGFERDIRLCFSWEGEELLGEGIERLARTIRRMQSKGGALRQGPVEPAFAANEYD